MPNHFDKYDSAPPPARAALPSTPGGGNYFDRHDAGAKPAASTATPPPPLSMDPSGFAASEGMRDLAAPVVNFLDYPIRATAADVVGAVRGALPIDAASREAFFRERQKSLDATALPYTETGGKIAKAGEAVAHGIGELGRYTPPMLVMRAFGLEEPLAPAMTAVGDVMGLAGFSRSALNEARGTASRAGEAAGSIGERTPAQLDKYIVDNFTNAVKPSKKNSAADIASYNSNALTGIDNIIRNKGNLKYETEKGDVVGQTPRSLDEFSEAIGQTKEAIFQRYDGMARQAAQQGESVSLAPMVAEMEKIAADRVIQTEAPAVANYAREKADAYRATEGYTPLEAQQAIQMANARLKAFWNNRTPEGADRASIDAAVMNVLRKSLDETIESSGHPGYQALKREYGSLKEIEKDVAGRASIVARQDKGGGMVSRLSEVATAHEVIRGVLTGNWRAVATGAGIKATTQALQYLRGPDRAITKMFEAAEKKAAMTPRPPDPVGWSTGAMQPPRPTDGAMPRQSGGVPAPPGGHTAPGLPLPSATPPGQQPAAPGGRNQKVYGGSGNPEQTLQSRGGQAVESMGLQRRGQRYIETDPFTNVPGGGSAQ